MKLPTILLFVEHYNGAGNSEERDFVGEGGGQSCGCATAQGDQQ